MMPTASSRARRRPAQAGFTLLSVLVSVFITGIGLLGILRAMTNVSSAATQNQIVSSAATLSNGFWSVTQWTPLATVTTSFPGTYDLTTSTAITGAPVNLQPWLTQVQTQLPQAKAVIAVNDTSCLTNCQLTLTLSWQQVGTIGATSSTRTQTFYYAL